MNAQGVSSDDHPSRSGEMRATRSFFQQEKRAKVATWILRGSSSLAEIDEDSGQARQSKIDGKIQRKIRSMGASLIERCTFTCRMFE